MQIGDFVAFSPFIQSQSASPVFYRYSLYRTSAVLI
nr:MAG TPA: hypothetical protein [Caudoviricetes sp.]